MPNEKIKPEPSETPAPPNRAPEPFLTPLPSDPNSPVPPQSKIENQKSKTPPAPPPLSYPRKVLIAVAISLAALLLISLIYYMAQLLVVCFAGLLFSVFLSAPADLLSRHTRMSRNYALALVVGSLLFIVVFGGYFMGARIYKQGVALSHTLPIALAQAEHDLYKYVPAPREVPDEPTTTPATTTTPAAAPSIWTAAAATKPTATQPPSEVAIWIAGKIIQLRQALTDFLLSESFVKGAGGLVSTTFGVIGNLILILGLGVFFAMAPASYSRGAILLVPIERRKRVLFIFSQIVSQLQWWFVGQTCSMLTVGLLVFIGLQLLNVQMAFTLAILAGLLNFVPYVGPLCAAVLGILVAFAPVTSAGESVALYPHLAAWTLALYASIQILDGWVFTPFYQKRAVNIPPALIILAQIALSMLLGPLGLILATPILACILVLTRTLYIEDVLGDTPLRTTSTATVKERTGTHSLDLT